MTWLPSKPMAYADFSATLSCHWLCRWLLCTALVLVNGSAWGKSYQAQDESLHTVFTVLSLPLGVPVVASREVARKRFSGTVDLEEPQQALEALALQHGLIWHSDGQVLYLYDASEAKSSAVTLRHISVDRFRSLMRRSGFDENRHPLRVNGQRTFYVSGPPRYVDQVLNLAQLMDRQRAALRVGNQAFAVVQILNTHVADREYAMGEDKVVVPGMASMIKTLLAGEQKGPLADKGLAVIAYPDTNSLLVKGKPAQLGFIEQLVAELDTPKRAIEVSLWLVDVEREALEKLDPAWGKEVKTQVSRVFEPLDDERLMAQIATLERRRRARVLTLPVILTQENVPAVFRDNHTFYLPAPGEDDTDWKPVSYGSQVSVLPRFVGANQIEMLLDIVDGRQVSEVGRRGKPTAVGQVGVSSVVRAPQGKRLWLGAFSREERAQGRSAGSGSSSKVRLFVIQARAVADEPAAQAAGSGPPPLTSAQYERVQRAFVRPGRDISP
ncbi:type III secretion system outer membrane ring subunit SctC [Pseudomonas sp. EYE_354]|uniref:type III secretion system outer membrane ring subunit SctC n=1 Tax=Pseudomonas sp. EYE_354 TaxID=2853449 RepID=UPI0020063701|nr:type III secretion system outer membrane ring subunit SctC [Pseudomonas sp. EYE_354]